LAPQLSLLKIELLKGIPVGIWRVGCAVSRLRWPQPRASPSVPWAASHLKKRITNVKGNTGRALSLSCSRSIYIYISISISISIYIYIYIHTHIYIPPPPPHTHTHIHTGLESWLRSFAASLAAASAQSSISALGCLPPGNKIDVGGGLG